MEFWITKCDEIKKFSNFWLIKRVNFDELKGVRSKMTRG